tara:strand:- start:32 stop:577 length:546 start_codon:yes stop_codon:yes gene_type:complete
MSILKVDTINEKTSGNGVQIAGHVVQTLSDTSTVTESTNTRASSNTFANSSLSITITPKSASSKIVVNAVVSTGAASGADASVILRLVRDSTPIGIGDASGNRIRAGSGRGTENQGNNSILNIPLQAIDTPNTTSAITYTVQFAIRGTGVTTSYLNRSGSDGDTAEHQRTSSSLVIQEIAQ